MAKARAVRFNGRPMSSATRLLRLPSGQHLAVQEYGATEGEPLFFCHGWPGMRHQAERLEEAAREFGFASFLSIDRASHFPPDPARRSLLDWPPLLAAAAQELGVETFRILGVSGGGPYALATAWAMPERVLAAVVVCGAPPIAELPDRRRLMPAYQALLAVHARSPGTVRWLFRALAPLVQVPLPRKLWPLVGKFVGPDDASALADPAIFQSCYQAFRAAWKGGADGVFQDAQIYARPWGFAPEEIRVPVQVWHGRGDTNFAWTARRGTRRAHPRCGGADHRWRGPLLAALPPIARHSPAPPRLRCQERVDVAGPLDPPPRAPSDSATRRHASLLHPRPPFFPENPRRCRAHAGHRWLRIRPAKSARSSSAWTTSPSARWAGKRPQLLDYAASLKLDSLLISDLDAYESLDDAHLREVKKKADGLGIALYAGGWSICPTSVRFKHKWGTAEEHLRLGLRVAKTLGSPGLPRRPRRAPKIAKPRAASARASPTPSPVLKACRQEALDAGVKIAVENHAGDMHSWELRDLIEAAGTDFVGANIDSGNAAWTLEDPHGRPRKSRQIHHLLQPARRHDLGDARRRDRRNGPPPAKVSSTGKNTPRAGLELCPQVPIMIETISGFSRNFPYKNEDFWKHYDKRPEALAHFEALAKRGHAIPNFKAPEGADKKQAEQEYQKAELERSHHISPRKDRPRAEGLIEPRRRKGCHRTDERAATEPTIMDGTPIRLSGA